VLDTLVYLKRETHVWFEITTLLIPGKNDSDEELRAMSAWIMKELGPDVPLHFSAFHPDYRMLDVPPTPPATLQRARRIAHDAGLRYVYVGNIHDEAGSSTYCPGCGAKTIGRDWYVLTQWQLDGASCGKCGTTLPGRFESKPGTWGARRQVIDMSSFA
jgi:pyruvate formate lyase activating enzyme